MPLLALSTLSLPQFPSWGICREHPGWLLPHPSGDVPGAGAAAPKLAAGWQGTTPMGHVTILSPPHRFKMSPGSLGGTKMFIVHREQSPCALGKGTHGRTGPAVRPAWGWAGGGSMWAGRGGWHMEAGWGQWCSPLAWHRAQWLTHSLSWGSPSDCRFSPLCTSWGRGPAGTGVRSSTGCPRQRAGGHWRPSRCRGQPPTLS